MKIIKVKNISCDQCGYYDSAEKFPDLFILDGRYYTDGSKKILEKFGLELSNPEHKEIIGTIYAGAICPICGNISEFDFDLDNNKLERIVEEPIVNK